MKAAGTSQSFPSGGAVDTATPPLSIEGKGGALGCTTFVRLTVPLMGDFMGERFVLNSRSRHVRQCGKVKSKPRSEHAMHRINEVMKITLNVLAGVSLPVMIYVLIWSQKPAEPDRADGRASINSVDLNREGEREGYSIRTAAVTETKKVNEENMDASLNAVIPTNHLDQLLKIISEPASGAEGRLRHYEAASALKGLGSEAVSGLGTYRALFRAATEDLRMAGAAALAFTSPVSPDAYNELVGGLQDVDPKVKVAASHGLGILFGERFADVEIENALPYLRANLGDANSTVRADTATALGQFIEREIASGRSGNPEMFIDALTRNLADDNPWVRTRAILTLQQYGSAAVGILPRLNTLTQDGDKNVQGAAATAIQRIKNNDPPIR